jgi:hypothetical protein
MSEAPADLLIRAVRDAAGIYGSRPTNEEEERATLAGMVEGAA